LESLSYARQGRTAVRIPDANGSIVLPESWTNSLIQVMAVNWIKKTALSLDVSQFINHRTAYKSLWLLSALTA
jgi:hypothetical protein